jgi:hypothetical protein
MLISCSRYTRSPYTRSPYTRSPYTRSPYTRSRSATVPVRCEGSANKNNKNTKNINKLFPLLNGPTAQKRNETIKENINKAIALGTKEFKDAYDIVVELDLAHKKAFKIDQEAEDKGEGNDTAEDSENIFLEDNFKDK